MKHLSPKEAFALLQADPQALLIDVRSEIEFLFVGHPVGAIHVSWNDGPDWEINPHFVGEVKKLAGHGGERPVVLICRSGNRSEAAGNALIEAGFSNVFNVSHGFEGELDDSHHRNAVNGWRFDGLPWQQC
ncbi:MAG: sulfurtransferase [Betaproteobacteria bacterium HGW-Betaproteobacteria-13]|jgi:rhodanese-related sulfurtransferase|uniref:Sulfurtransferase n=1 Tax=Parazoarcus communis TaxID=41977 RepID=A0A2U8GUQ3_9RHOO|nr:rhodanese-like domain-containing protein [Parazoarcus communis]PKO80751.1 MAG: sulfurtransferase [Betaproteobacteria bacterium HGW-Betaproteobacteria-13]PLX74229.1 MAG: sulfurtransferase [Azoarcus sp.]TVT59023.1 MAG: rhodanese-like domain-containing protein [Azoarcus sp. PHD]AWI76746.1 sulfurtransferase [Parazoarcus communis]AWI79476.1 sulfurtransferase [Parazoarcus communis]